jgi:protein TonB
MLVLALSLCNLMGRRRGNNSNSNTSGTENTSAENSNAPPLEQGPPRSTAAAPPGVHTLNANQNSAASEPPPPPPTKPTAPRAPISGGVLNGKAINLVQPPYPPIAKAAHASGQVTVRVLIDEEGNVVSATAVSGHPLLQGAAIAAARASKFSPTKLSGQPVKVVGVVIYNFVEQ